MPKEVLIDQGANSMTQLTTIRGSVITPDQINLHKSIPLEDTCVSGTFQLNAESDIMEHSN